MNFILYSVTIVVKNNTTKFNSKVPESSRKSFCGCSRKSNLRNKEPYIKNFDKKFVFKKLSRQLKISEST